MFEPIIVAIYTVVGFGLVGLFCERWSWAKPVAAFAILLLVVDSVLRVVR